jgi:anti-sigma-K factor RskA
MSTEHVQELLDLYILDALEPEEQALVDDHLEICATCRQELERSKQVLALLAWTPDQRDPSPDLYDRLVLRLAPRAPQLAQTRPARAAVPAAPPRRRWWSLPPQWGFRLAALATCMALLLGGWGLRQQRQVEDLDTRVAEYDRIASILRASEMQLVVLQPQNPDLQGTQARLLLDLDDSDAFMAISSLPALPKGQAYQLWMIDGDQPLSAGVFQVGPQGEASMVVDMPDRARQYDAVGITVEPEAGSVQPTSKPILLTAF